MRADLLLTNGTIHTLDDDHATVASLAVARGRIVALDQEVDAHAVVDLHGATVLPGFHDAHNHMVGFGLRLGEIDLSHPAVTDLDELYAAVADAAAGAEHGAWIVGGGYDQNKLGGEHPTRQALDRIAPDRPVWLKHTSGHMAVVNSAVLAMTDPDAAPPGGVVVRDDASEPTGLLQEQAQGLVADLVRPYSHAQLVEAITAASARYAAEGLVAATECGIGAGWVGNSPVEAAAYQTCLDDGALLQRITLMPVSDALRDVGRGDDGPAWALDLGLRTGFGSDRLRLGAMKVFSDGSLIGRTAAMCCEFDGSPGNAGYLQEEVEALRHKLTGAHRAGWQVATHAIGDRAVQVVLDIYEEMLAAEPRVDHRHRIEHCGVCRPEDLARIARLGVIPIPQGRFVYEIGDGMMAALGPERTDWCYRGQSFLDAGITLAGSSDRPVVIGAPLLGIEAMVTRRTAGGEVMTPGERLSVFDALRAYTLGSATACFLDQQSGTLELGKYADLVVLDADPMAVAPEEIGTIGVRATMLEGALTHGEL